MQVDLKLQVLETVGFLVAFGLALFLPAGTLAWPAGWAFLVLFFAFYVSVTAWLFRHNPALMQERLRLGTPDQQGWDKLLFPLMLLLPFATMVFISFDTQRFHWSSMPAWLQGLGGFILLGSFYLLFLTFRENSYLAAVVRVQEERGQTVISSGPYRFVRHPMYSGILVFMLGMCFLLGSWYGLLFALLFTLILARRAVLEEGALRRDLPGYAAYAARVKYRLVPYIW
ncbi:MAG: isoprenylcysteine carboxylmethyltransferase family protein [Anaerolineales bacterium]